MSEAGGAASGAFKVNSLTGLDRADPVEGRVIWDVPRSLWNMAMLAISAGPSSNGNGAYAANQLCGRPSSNSRSFWAVPRLPCC